MIRSLINYRILMLDDIRGGRFRQITLALNEFLVFSFSSSTVSVIYEAMYPFKRVCVSNATDLITPIKLTNRQ